MTKPTGRKKRSKLKILLLAPIFPLIFLAGWSLYCIGHSWHQHTKQLQKPTHKTPTKHDGVEFRVIPQEEQIQIN